MSTPSYLYVNYTPVATPVAVPAIHGAKNFLAQRVANGNQNQSTSGAVIETVNQSLVVVVTFTLQALQLGVDYEAWADFAEWAAMGEAFVLAPSYPRSSKEYNCVSLDSGFTISRAGMMRYNADFKFQILNDSSAPSGAREVMQSFWGLA